MEKLKILFVGDTTATGRFREPIAQKREIFSPEVIQLFGQADYVIANLEGPVTNSKTFLKCNGLTVSAPGSIGYFTSRNVKIFNLANNHMFDNGVVGFHDTIREIKANNGSYFGAGNSIDEASIPFLIKDKGIKVAVWGLAHKEGLLASDTTAGVFCEKDRSRIKADIKRYKGKGFFIILCYHGGEEFTLLPTPSRRRRLNALIDLGSDLVISNHSHVVQGYEMYKSKHVFNSLGNFVFDIPQYRGIPYVDESVILSLNITKEGLKSFDLLPIKVDYQIPSLSLDYSGDIKDRIARYSNLKQYYSTWLAESERVFFLKRNNSISDGETKFFPNGMPEKQVKTFQKIIKLSKKLISSPVKRELFFSMLLSKVLRLKKNSY